MKYDWKDLLVPAAILFVCSAGAVAIRILVPDAAQGPIIVALLALMIGGAVSSLTWIIKRARDRVIAEGQSDRDRVIADGQSARDLVIAECHSDLWHIAEGITDRHLRAVKDFFFDQSRLALEAMADKRFDDVDDALMKWTKHVDHVELPRFREIFAVCGNKNYTDPGVQKYYEANYTAARRGIHVQRIFILPEGAKKFPVNEAKVIQDHLDIGEQLEQKMGSVQALVLTWDDSKNVRNRFQIPKGYGFAALDDCVGVHWGFQPNTVARLFDGPIAVALFRGIFDRLYVHAKSDPVYIRTLL